MPERGCGGSGQRQAVQQAGQELRTRRRAAAFRLLLWARQRLEGAGSAGGGARRRAAAAGRLQRAARRRLQLRRATRSLALAGCHRGAAAARAAALGTPRAGGGCGVAAAGRRHYGLLAPPPRGLRAARVARMRAVLPAKEAIVERVGGAIGVGDGSDTVTRVRFSGLRRSYGCPFLCGHRRRTKKEQELEGRRLKSWATAGHHKGG